MFAGGVLEAAASFDAAFGIVCSLSGNRSGSLVPPNLTRNLEAKIQSQKYEIQSLQKDLHTTQDSLNSWDQ